MREADRFLTTAQVAARYHTTAKAIHKRVQRGHIPTSAWIRPTGSRKLLFRPEVLERLEAKTWA